jgi:hypothetical protein
MKSKAMDWINTSLNLFKAEKPEHFTDFTHCEECEEHDQTLLNATILTIGLEELGNPGWDPICFCNEIGKMYLTPAFVRLSLETVNSEFYFGQFLFHLEHNGENNKYFLACSPAQRSFLAEFIGYMISSFASEIERNFYTEEALRAYEIWSHS